MKSILTTILLVASILITTKAQEIDRSNHNLLWEITGNEFEKPSYLFGSMHVEDERVFEFSDSMLVCFENCKGFSSELNMDSMVHFIMTQIFSGDTSNILKDLLSPEAYEGLNNKLLNKSGQNIEDLDNKQPWMIEMLMNDDPEEKETDFDAFLDLFLYNYAKKRGKETYGLEKIEDQLSLSLLKYQTYEEYLVDSLYQKEDSPEDAEKELESLKKIYLSGDINVIDEIFVKPMPNDIYKQKLLTDRNIVMADNIEKLGNEMPMFNVVGAAHLPGDLGVIDLLRKRGYHVRAVTAEFTGKNQLKDVSNVILPWKTLDIKERMECTMEFPIQAVKFNQYEGSDFSDLDFYFSMDFETQEVYTFLGIENPSALSEEEGAELLDISLSKMFEDNEGLDSETIEDPIDVEYEGFKGKELRGTTVDGGEFMGRAFIQSDKVYYLYVIREKGKLKNADRFFNSFHLFPSSRGMVEGKVVMEDYALSFEAPVPFEYIVTESVQEVGGTEESLESHHHHHEHGSTQEIEETEEILKLHQYRGTNKEGTIYYIFQVYDLVQGTYLDDVNRIIEDTRNNFASEGTEKVKIGEPQIINHVYYQNMTFERGGIFYEIDFCFRGSRIMMTLVLGEDEKSTKKASKEFLSSIKLLDFKESEFTKNKMEELGVEVSLPTQEELEINDDASFPNQMDYQLRSTDLATNTPFVFEAIEMSEYYEIEHPDTFLLELMENMKDENSEVLYSEIKKYQGYPSFDIAFKAPTSNVVLEVRLCLVDNWIYSISIYLPEELSRTDYVKECFNSLKINPNFKRKRLAESKAEQILKDITSLNIEVFEKAEEALNYHEFDNDDLPLIYEVLNNGIPLDTDSGNYYSVKKILINKLSLINNEGTIPFLKELFFKSETKEQISIVGVIGKLENSPYSTYWALINQIVFLEDDYNFYSAVNHFDGNLESIVDNIPQLMELSEKKYFREDVYSLLYFLVRQDSVSWEPALKPYQQGIVDAFKVEFDSCLGKKEAYKSWTPIRALLAISSKFSDKKDLLAFIQENIKFAESSLLTHMAVVLLRNDVPLEKEIWDKLEKEYLLYGVIGNLSEGSYDYSKIKLIPKKYKNQKTAAQIGMIMSFEYDYTIGKIELIKMDKTIQKGKSYNRYIYRIKRSENEDDNIIGLALYPTDKKMYNLRPLYYDYGSLNEDEETLEEYIEHLMQYF